jgi:3-carboxy-cis,cis-muconate cycloisomerase
MMDAGLLSPVRAGTPIEEAVSDLAFLQAMLDAEAALARAQARLEVVPAEAAAVISRTAQANRFDLRALAMRARESANPVVGLVRELTRLVAAEDETAAESVHLGSTSQDILDTGLMLMADRAVQMIRVDLRRTADALGRLAAENRDTAMAGRTLAMHAVPVTFGLKAAGWRELVLAADRRLDVRLPFSLGGAAGTLAGYLAYAGEPGEAWVDRLLDAFAAETGLCRPTLPWHALRTPIADLAAALATTAGALGKMAVDVLTLTRTEIGEVTEPTVAGRGGSSAMPHKHNPVLSTLIRSAALQVPLLAAGLTQALVTEDERSGGVWQAEWQPLRECLRLTGGAAHTAVELAEGLQVRPDRMRANLELTGSQVVSERLVAALTPTLGKAAARRLLSEAVEEAARSGRPLVDVLAERTELPPGLNTDPADYTGAAGHLVDRALER